MTNEEWEQIETGLSGLFYTHLLCDGYKISLRLTRRKMKLYLAVYVNGIMRVEYCKEESEIREKFMCPQKHFVWSAKARKRLKKFSKKRREELGLNPDEFYLYYIPLWNSFSALKKHLIKNCDSIEVWKDAD